MVTYATLAGVNLLTGDAADSEGGAGRYGRGAVAVDSGYDGTVRTSPVQAGTVVTRTALVPVAAASVPANGRFGIYMPESGYTVAALAVVEAMAGRHMDLLIDYQDWDTGTAAEIWVCETACSEPEAPWTYGGVTYPASYPVNSKASWVTTFLSSTAYPRLTTVVWFNIAKERNWIMSSSADSTAAFYNAFANSRSGATHT